MNDLLSLSGVAQARLIRDGALSSEELVRLHLDRIADVNPKINAAVEVLTDTAVGAARAADARYQAGAPLSPLDGVPFSVKDSIAVKDCVVTAGTLGYQNSAPCAEDATLVHRLRNAGAIPLARTNLPDLLFSFESDNLLHGRTNNPYDLARTPGGSSGGESALISACGSPFGLGSDALGSVRTPAHCCGIASLKPTTHRLSRTGHIPPQGGWVEAVWQIGPMARRVDDLIAMMPLLLGPDLADYTLVDMPCGNPDEVTVGALRIAYFTDNGFAPPDRATREAIERAARLLRAVEHRPPGVEDAYGIEMQLLAPDGGDSLREFLQSIGSTRTHPLLESWLQKHEPFRTDLAGLARCWAAWDRFRAGMHAFLTNWDVLLSPVAAQPAWPHGTSADMAVFRGFSYTMAHNLTGWPAAVVRCGTSPDGLPIGIQIAAAPWREDIVLAVARRIEQELGGWQAPAAL